MDSSDKLSRLRIDRSEPPPSSGNGRRYLIASIVLAVALGGSAWMVFGRTPTWVVSTAMAQPATTASAAVSATGSVLDATGYVVARRQATVSAQIIGTLTQVLIEEGERVEAGQVLATLEDTAQKAALAQAEAQLHVVRAQLAQFQSQHAQSRRDLERAEDLVTQKLVSPQSVEVARTQVDMQASQLQAHRKQVELAEAGVQAARVQLNYCTIHAPFAGVVTSKAAQVGEIVSPTSAGGGFTRTGIGTIVDMTSLEIEVDVNESYIARVKPDAPVESTLNAYPNWKIPGKVIAIIPAADRGKATVKVRIGIDTKDDRIAPDMGARVAFMKERKSAAAASQPPEALPGAFVPGNAIKSGAGGSVVYVVRNGKAEERKVSLGQTMGASRQILSGVAVGERVVLEPPDGLQNGGRIATN